MKNTRSSQRSRRSGRLVELDAQAELDRPEPPPAARARKIHPHRAPKKARPTLAVGEILSTPAAVRGKDASGAGWGAVKIVKYNASSCTYVVRRLDAGDASDFDSEWACDDARFKGSFKLPLSAAGVASAKGSSACGAPAATTESTYPLLARESRGATLIGFNLLAEGREVTITAYSTKPMEYTVVDDVTKVAVKKRNAEAWLCACRLIAMPFDAAKRVQFRDYSCLAEGSVVQAIIREKIASGAYIAAAKSGGKTFSMLSAGDALDDPSYKVRLTAARIAASTPATLRLAATSCAPPALKKCGKSCQNRKGGKDYPKILNAAKTSDAAILRKRTRAQRHKLSVAQRAWDTAAKGGKAAGKRPSGAAYPKLTARPRPPPKEGCPGNFCKAFFKPARPAQTPSAKKCWAKCWCDVCNEPALFPRGCVYIMTGSLLVYEAKFSTPEGEAARVARHSVQAAVRGPVRPMLRTSAAVAAALARVDVHNVSIPTSEEAYQRVYSPRKRKRAFDKSRPAVAAAAMRVKLAAAAAATILDTFASVGAAAAENALCRAHSLQLPLPSSLPHARESLRVFPLPSSPNFEATAPRDGAVMALEAEKAAEAEEEMQMTQELVEEEAAAAGEAMSQGVGEENGGVKAEPKLSRSLTLPLWTESEAMRHVYDSFDGNDAMEALLEVARRAAASLPLTTAANASSFNASAMARTARSASATKAPLRLEVEATVALSLE